MITLASGMIAMPIGVVGGAFIAIMADRMLNASARKARIRFGQGDKYA